MHHRQARQKEFRVGSAKIRWSAEGTSTLEGSEGMLPRQGFINVFFFLFLDERTN